MNEPDLAKLAEPFPADDIEWRICRSGMGKRGVFAFVLAYITARAIQERLDAVCRPQNWRTEEPRMIEINGKAAFAVGISIYLRYANELGEWVTKWDVSEPTNIDPAKGGFSGAMKRAGAQWGIGRYLYHLPEVFAVVSDQGGRGWKWARLSKQHGEQEFFWKPPALPGWALPKEPETEITIDELTTLKKDWRDKFADGCKDPNQLREGFHRFVASVVGEFPMTDHACWTRDAWERCRNQLEETQAAGGVAGDVPFT